jgi:hypothetical protein
MLRPRLLGALASFAILALATAPAAGAATLNLSGFPATFPKASALCAKASKGKLGKKLSPSKGKVLKACNTLRKSYSDAYTTLSNAVAPLRQQSRDAVEGSRTACREAKRARNLTACRQAQIDARSKLRALREQTAPHYATARKAYEAARKTFWATIKKLKGGAAITPDKSVTEPTQDVVPDDKAVDEA